MESYVREWVSSGVDEELIRLNVQPLEGIEAGEYLLYAEQLPRRNDGRVETNILKRYSHTELGGWWCSGVDVLTGENDIWGCFKPHKPRRGGKKNKAIKYEHPPMTPTGIFALKVPSHLWEKIGATVNKPILAEDTDRGFWQWLKDNPDVPLCITEGAKKAGALLTAGYASIGLPGINNGYRRRRDDKGIAVGKSHLIPQLKELTDKGREIYIVFDQDCKPKTLRAVNTAIKKLGYLLGAAGCKVKVITWDNKQGKGIDDVIGKKGEKYFQQLYDSALTLDNWKARESNRLTYEPNLGLNHRYLPPLTIPDNAQLIAIKSGKGTGKTQNLANIVKQALDQGKKILVIGHRVRLVQELCHRFGLPYITEVTTDNEGFGYGLCIDSLHPKSQAQFNALHWEDSVIIIDEIEQVLWHGLNGETCKNNRVAILKSFKLLVQTVLDGAGQIYIADADLSDVSLDYLISLSGIDPHTYVIANDWRPSYQEAWQVHNYTETNPRELVKDLVKHIKAGGKPFVCLSAQKLTSQWGTYNLESYLKKQFPKAKILRIDSESLNDPSHEAYGCMKNCDGTFRAYDVVLASPAIETGISIDLKAHFTSVWCIAQGIQTPTSICQFLGRIRENVPRYIWSAAYGFNKIGNGSTSIPNLLASGEKLTATNLRLLQQSDIESLDDLDTGFQAESLLCWAKMAVRVNLAMLNYRETIKTLLEGEGHIWKERGQVEENGNSNRLTEAINEIKEQNYENECLAIASATPITETQYKGLKKCLMKTPQQRRSVRKYELQKRYGIEITPQLVSKDDRGWYQELRLHYFLTIGRRFLCDREALNAQKLIRSGEGSLFIPDFNHSQLGSIIGMLEVLGISVLIADGDRELHNRDPELQAMATIALKHRHDIKSIAKVTIAKNNTPITIIRRLLNLIGHELKCIKSKKINNKLTKIYQILQPYDEREIVLRNWLIKDEYSPGSSEIWSEDYVFGLHRGKKPRPEDDQYVQLSLKLN
ncbi:MAG: hypothetical protein N5P05_000840 [Chroococcopsis gigantea SAG 12.99]|jgi:hypothetical protein|nr:DUF3854 domain-containing protein [Chlorogloea purpurea SAG 13.99]MDV2999234.1 hypothetical protein [Chroococcopsis gigantea SAG 12.99]